jgi:hypothetical protein
MIWAAGRQWTLDMNQVSSTMSQQTQRRRKGVDNEISRLWACVNRPLLLVTHRGSPPKTGLGGRMLDNAAIRLIN